MREEPLFLTSTGRTLSVRELTDRVERSGVSFAVGAFDERTRDTVVGISHERSLFLSAAPFEWSASELSERLARLIPDAVVRSPDRIRSTVEAEAGIDVDAEHSGRSDTVRAVERELAILCEDQEVFGSHRAIERVEFVEEGELPIERTAGGTLNVSREEPVVAHLLEAARHSEGREVVAEAFLVAWIYGRVAPELRGLDAGAIADVDARQAVRVWRHLSENAEPGPCSD